MAEGVLRGRAQRGLFTLAIFVGSFLLFLVQPMVARMALPRLGGAPNVWNSAMLVYQALLLGGYAYAHFIGRLAIGRQAVVHIALLLIAGFSLPLALPEGGTAQAGWEVVWVPWLFLLTVGPVFFVVSAQAPLMQRWYAANPDAGDPYPLYAASNLGSFGGLLAYPFLVEPLMPLGAQSRLWMFGYGLLVGLVLLVAWTRSRQALPAMPSRKVEAAKGEGKVLLWLGLAAVPSGLMLSTTTFFTTDIMAMPLLWVIPLGLYLLSFSVAFAQNSMLARVLTRWAPIVVLLCAPLSFVHGAQLGLIAGGAAITLLFVGSVALHRRMFESRPPAEGLTHFYLVMSAGGALGGLFTALIAPVVFDWTWEHPILIVALAALLPLDSWHGLATKLTIRPQFLRTATILLALAAILAAGIPNQLQVSAAGNRTRSYFGIYTIAERDNGQRWLMHGTTTHGVQIGQTTAPTSYYGRQSGAGLVLDNSEQLVGANARIGVVGLGVGTLSCYAHPGQDWTFFEIDPAVVELSTQGRFSFMSQCAPDVEIDIGDARLELSRPRQEKFDILVIDAFSSDAIPLHLVTAEALAVYREALAPDGILLIHISNRFIAMEPVVAALARDAGLQAAIRKNRPKPGLAQTASDWVVLVHDTALLDRVTKGEKWQPLVPPAQSTWTDEFASVLPYFKWDSFL